MTKNLPNNPCVFTDPVARYIHENFDRSIYFDEPGSGYEGIDLPYPYSSPCIKGEGKFSFFFYWDTHFTNLGLLRTNRADTAKNNIRNMLWLIDRYGYMPNHIGLDNRSQPPYLCRMVKDYFTFMGGPAADPDFFRQCAEGLRKEYHFWRTARSTPAGLCRFASHHVEEGFEYFYNTSLVRRLRISPDIPREDKIQIGQHYLAEAESGSDFTPRFDKRCLDFCAVELNALLYEYETTLAEWAPQLNWDQDLFASWAKERKARMHRFMWNEERGLFFDYDFVNHKQSLTPAQSGYQTMFSGAATPEQAQRMVENLPLFEREYGMAYTPELPDCRSYQWAFPNIWPPMVSVMVEGLIRYGYESHARRLAEKYVATTRSLYKKTGQLWEKIDAETGEVAGGEYEAAPMIGWSAGVYLQCLELIETSTTATDTL
ncbi:trehalase family glycosidase [Kiritimatiellaeota bacterium B1221]|nr:trehalase family glycosidase [Kiritimatiellaeota bacterium B1221]